MLHLPLKPSPNETTTPVLSARGARRAALGSGLGCVALRASTILEDSIEVAWHEKQWGYPQSITTLPASPEIIAANPDSNSSTSIR